MNVIVPNDGGEPISGDSRCMVHLERTFKNQYGLKVTIDLPHPDENGGPKEDLKQLNWNETHREWSPAANAWIADLEHLNHIVNHMNDQGYDVSVNLQVARAFEEEFQTFLPERR